MTASTEAKAPVVRPDDRVAPPALSVAALKRPSLDPEVVSQLVSASHRSTGLAGLTPRERDVLTLMAEGRSNAGIATALVVSASVVEKHVARVFDKLGLSSAEADNRRVLAVLRYLSLLIGVVTCLRGC